MILASIIHFLYVLGHFRWLIDILLDDRVWVVIKVSLFAPIASITLLWSPRDVTHHARRLNHDMSLLLVWSLVLSWAARLLLCACSFRVHRFGLKRVSICRIAQVKEGAWFSGRLDGMLLHGSCCVEHLLGHYTCLSCSRRDLLRLSPEVERGGSSCDCLYSILPWYAS